MVFYSKSYFCRLGGIEFLLNCIFDVTKILVILSNFHKQVSLSNNINVAYNVNLMIRGVNITDKKCSNKFIRKLCQIHTMPTKSKGMSEFDSINWKVVWNYNHRYCVTNKVREVSFKIIHLIYLSNKTLQKVKVNIDENCVFCSHSCESICHLFSECSYVKYFWLEIEHIFNMSIVNK